MLRRMEFNHHDFTTSDHTLVNSIAEVLYNSHNYTISEEKEIFPSADRSIVVCIANEGVISLGGYNKVHSNKKATKSSSKPGSSMSGITSSNFCVGRIETSHH
jgi:hypothetical protein